MGLVLQTIIKRALSFNILTLIILAFLTQLTIAGNANYPSNALEKNQKTFEDFNVTSQFNHQTGLNRFKRGSIGPPNVNNTLNDIYKSIDEMRQNITILQAGSSNPQLNTMISIWSTKVDDLQKSADNERQHMHQHNKNVTDKVQEMFQLSERYKQQLEEIARKQLPDDAVREIRSDRFSSAVEKLLLLKDYTDIKYVVRMVYNNHPDNFNLILRFGIFIQNGDFKIRVFKALYELMNEFGNPDMWKLIQLAYAAKAVTSGTNVDFWNVLWQEEIVNPIADAIINNTTYSMPKQSIKGSSSYCFPCLLDIYNKVIQQVWNKVNEWDLFPRVQSDPDYLEGHIAVQLAVANYLKYDFKNHNVIILAKNIKLTMENNRYKSVRQEEKTAHENLKNKLPESIRNLVFSKVVCLKNTRYNENLMASKRDGCNSDTRAIYTVHPASYSDHGKEKWIITFTDHNSVNLTNLKYGGIFHARNVKDSTYASDTKRYVYLWLTNFCKFEECIWEIEVDGDEVQFKNVRVKEYLYANYEDGDEGTCSVYTYRPGNKTNGSKWKILDCSTY